MNAIFVGGPLHGTIMDADGLDAKIVTLTGPGHPDYKYRKLGFHADAPGMVVYALPGANTGILQRAVKMAAVRAEFRREPPSL